MTLTRETVEKLLAKIIFEVINGEMNETLAEEVGATLLAAWAERDALMEAVQANLLRPNYVRAEAAEARLAERDAEIARLRDAAADRIEALAASPEVQALVMAEREQMMDACNEYMAATYGISAIGHPIDRARIETIRAGGR
jgi:ribosomal protein S12 methylthiotransferase accessory factor YcaO